MIAVIFEVYPAEGRVGDYLGIAASLKTELEAIDGFISVERFESLTTPGKVLSLSFFESEEAVTAWRNTASHRRAQAAGRGGIFADYRLRVAHVLLDYGMTARRQAPPDSPSHAISLQASARFTVARYTAACSCGEQRKYFAVHFCKTYREVRRNSPESGGFLTGRSRKDSVLDVNVLHLPIARSHKRRFVAVSARNASALLAPSRREGSSCKR